MIKKIGLLVMGLVMLCGVSFAESISILDNLKSLPALKQGVAYSALDSKFNYITTMEVANLNQLTVPVLKDFIFDIGYAGTAEQTGDKLVAVVSYPLFDASKYINWPVAKYVKVNPGVYVGSGRLLGSTEFDWGISFTAIEVKF